MANEPQQKYWSGDKPTAAQALEYIKKIAGRYSPSQIARVLSSDESFGFIDRVTVARWIQSKREVKHTDVQNRQIAAAIILRRIYEEVSVKIAVVSHATEALPVHLMEHLTRLKEGNLDVQLIQKADVRECVKAINAGEVDMIVASREEQPRSSTNPVQRLCKITEVPVRGIFPGYYQSEKSFAEAIFDLRNRIKNFTIGSLVNADYTQKLRSALKHNGGLPGILPVTDYQHAFELIRDGKIHGLVGHSIMIANCFELVSTQLKPAAKQKRLPPFDLFEHFENLKMDVYVNTDSINKRAPRLVLGYLDRVIRFLQAVGSQEDEEKEKFYHLVDDILALHSAPQKKAKEILQEYVYTMKTFETQTLLKLWQP